jgi:adenosylcobyric acid synthase
MELFTENERNMVQGFVINKFRGDAALLDSGVEFLETRTGKPVLGLVHYFSDIHIPEEDSVALDLKMRAANTGPKDGVRIGVVRLPHISNYTDFDCLEQEPSVNLVYFTAPAQVFDLDLVILPGSKNTLDDLCYLHDQGLADAITSFHAKGGSVVGICGGYQMLGRRVLDPAGVESNLKEMVGLDLLDMDTELLGEKVTTQVKARMLWNELANPEEQLYGYEIHMGRSKALGPTTPLLEIVQRNDESVRLQDGMVSRDGRVWGTYLHGLFDNDSLRHRLIRSLMPHGDGLPAKEKLRSFRRWKEAQYDRLAEHLRTHLDMDRIYQIMGLRSQKWGTL